MKKRLLIILSLVVLLGVAIGIGATVSASAETADFLVGYAVADITPRDEDGNVRTDVTVTGMGDTDSRKAIGLLVGDGTTPVAENVKWAYNLNATCVAMTDQNGNTLLMFTLDLIGSSSSACDAAKNRIQAELGIPVDHIMMSATHTHSAPGDSGSSYKSFLEDQLVNAAVAAYEDRAPIKEMKIGSVAAYANGDSLNGIRHYTVKKKDGTFYGYSGDNFGVSDSSYKYTQITEIDDTMHLLQFTFADKAPIVLANWRAHPTAVSTYLNSDNEKVYYNYLSADYVASFRANMYGEYGYRVAFFQGAAGNVNPRSREDGAPYTKYTNYMDYGKDLADCAQIGLTQNMSVVPAGNIKTTQRNLVAETVWKAGKTAAETITFPEGTPVSEALINMYDRMKDGAAASEFEKYNVNLDDGLTMLEQAVIISEAYYGDYLTKYKDDSGKTAYKDGPDGANDGAGGLVSGYGLNAAKEKVFNSGFDANNVVDNYNTYVNGTYKGTLVLNAITIGDHFSLVTAPGELFDTRNYTRPEDFAEGEEPRPERYNQIVEDVFEENDDDGNAVKRVFVMGYANGSKGYFPSYYTNGGDTSGAVYAKHVGYGGYETDVTNYEFGTYELIQKNFIDMLTSLQKGCECGAAAQGMDGHTCFDASWQDWNSTNSLPTVSGYYTLTGDVTLTDAQTIEADDEIHLDLNGYVVTVKGASGYVINDEDALLTITDTGVGGKFLCTATTEGAITVQKGTVKLYGGTVDGNNAGRPVNVTGGKLLVYGGVVTGGKTTNGGNLYVANGSQVTLYGGTISAGHATNGGNIYVAEGGKVTQQGGTVTGGCADQGTTNKYGGNLYIAAGGEYLLKDGSIADGSSYQGGNVYISKDSTMKLEGGTVTGGTATNLGTGIFVAGTLEMSAGTISGGNVYLQNKYAKLDMDGGEITGGVDCRLAPTVELSGAAVIAGPNSEGFTFGNTAAKPVLKVEDLTTGAKIIVKYSNFTPTLASRVFAEVDNAEDAGYFISGHDGYTVTANAENGLVLTEGNYACVCMGTAIGVGDHVCDTTAWEEWTESTSLPTKTGRYYLTKDVTVTTAQVIAAGENVCLDLNGFTVKGNGARVYYLYTENDTANRTLSITDSSAAKTGKITITGKTGSDQGGVIWANQGDVFLYGGTLDATNIKKADNTESKSGPVIYISAGHSFTMYNGTLLGSQNLHSTEGYTSTLKEVYGGAVCAATGSSFTMYNGSIVGGKATYGGAVYGGTGAQINLYGGTIYGGESTYGGALYLSSSQTLLNGTVITGGITTNNGGNVYIKNGSFTMISGEIAGGQTKGYNGGNVYAIGTANNPATLTVEGGTIRDGVAYARLNDKGTDSTGGVGGNLCISTDAVFNLVAGTITGGKTDKLEDAPKYTNGGNIYLSGTLNMTGGEISYGYAGNCGGNIAYYGTFEMSGGQVLGGACGANGSNMFTRNGTLKISGDSYIDGGVYIHSAPAKAVTISGKPVISGADTGTASYGIRVPGYNFKSDPDRDEEATYTYENKEGVTVVETTHKTDIILFENLQEGAKISVNMSLGKLADTDRRFALLSGTNENILKSVSYYTDGAKVVVDGDTLKFDFAQPVMIGDTGYATLKEAIEKYDSESDEVIKLTAELAEFVELTQSVKLDMNGYNLYGSITSKGTDVKLYGMDSKNNSYDTSACGTLMADLKNVTVATQTRYEDPTSQVVRHYVALDNLNGDYTFHRVYIKISTAMLRPDNKLEGAISPGLYFKSTMAGDAAVVGRLSYYGVAAAKNTPPTELEALKYSRFPVGTAFQPATAVVSNGTMITGIMTYTGSYDIAPKQPLEENLANAEVDVYGRPYMVLLDAEGNEMDPIFGDAYRMNLREAVETADAKYSTLNATAKKALDKLYAAFPLEASAWEVDESRIPMPVVVEAVITLPCDTPVFQIDVDTDIFS